MQTGYFLLTLPGEQQQSPVQENYQFQIKMSKKNKTIKELNLEFEILAQRVKKLEDEKDSSAIEKIEGLELLTRF